MSATTTIVLQTVHFEFTADGEVTEKEFLFIWKDRQLGDLSAASSFFHHIDTDRDNLLSEIPDMSRTFYYFDSNRKCSQNGNALFSTG